MAVTPVGNPYVESSDLVANYPGASEALAERIDIVGVNPFANAGARSTAIPSPTEGMMSSLNDTDEVQRYDGATWKLVGGKVLQVVSAANTSTFGMASATFTDITSLTVTTAALASTGSRVKITVSLGKVSIANLGGASAAFRLMRDAIPIALGDAAGSRVLASFATVPNIRSNDNYGGGGYSFTFVDSPSTTSAVVYKLQMATEGGTQGYINRTVNDTNASPLYLARTASTITVEEIA